MLSFERGRPVAYIHGGDNDGKIIRIFDKDDDYGLKKCCSQCSETCNKDMLCCDACPSRSGLIDGGCVGLKRHMDQDFIENQEPDIDTIDPFNLLSEDYIRKLAKKEGKGKMKQTEMNKLMYGIKNKQMPFENDLKGVYNVTKKELRNRSKKEFNLDTGKFQHLPNFDENQCERGMICGQSGSGKSTYAAEYAQAYRDKYPKRPIIIFSRLTEDPVLDKISGVKRIPLDDELVDEPINMDELAKSLVIFDDVESGLNKKLEQAILKLRDDCVMNGRKHKIHVVNCVHLSNDYKKTRALNQECNFVTLFPRRGSAHMQEYQMKHNIGLNREQINKIMNTSGRWVTIIKSYPMCVLSEHSCYLL